MSLQGWTKTVLVLVLLGTLGNAQVLHNNATEYTCFDISDPITQVRVPVKCFETIPHFTSPYGAGKGPAAEKPFEIQIVCTDTKRHDFCHHVGEALKWSTEILASIFHIEKTIVINGTFTDLGDRTIGNAAPARVLPITDDDNVSRFYPQALVKQLAPEPAPTYGPADVTMRLNTAMDWYFWGDSLEQKEGRFDMLGIVLHELLHGLGFFQNWELSENTPLYFAPHYWPTTDKKYYVGLVEFMSDRHTFWTGDNERLTEIISKWSDKLFGKDREHKIELPGSGEDLKNMKEYAKAMTKYAPLVSSTPDTIAFRTNKNSVAYLETSIPYRPGSSVSHLDLFRYEESPNFLMVYQDPALPLAQRILTANSPIAKNSPILFDYKQLSKIDFTKAVGPLIMEMMGTLGWTVNSEIKPYLLPKKDTSTAASRDHIALSAVAMAVGLVLCAQFAF